MNNGVETKQRRVTNGTSTNGSYSIQTYDEQPVVTTRKRNFMENLFHFTIFPVILMIFPPTLIVTIWYTAVQCDGSLTCFAAHVKDHGVIGAYSGIWKNINYTDRTIWCILAGYSIWMILLSKLLPGRRVTGPETRNGNTPVYVDNGFKCYVVTMIAFAALTWALKMNGKTPTIIFDRFNDVLGTLTVVSYVFCLLLYIKGRCCPSSTDCASSGNIIFDYFSGLELYPRVFGIDVKVFTNCRFGMTVWALLVCIFTLKSYELHGFVDSMWVSSTLQMVYITKFFLWESGYMRTIDIILDNAGFYICWGCLVYIPGVYASVSLYFVPQSTRIGPMLSVPILVVGIASCVINYLADKQKEVVRKADGKCLVWGRHASVIRATYMTTDGTIKPSLLLTCGYWGLARHFHYVPELILALSWTISAGFNHFLPYTYVIYLTILLVHRTYRDDLKCGEKYGTHWIEYCCRVPYRILPYIF